MLLLYFFPALLRGADFEGRGFSGRRGAHAPGVQYRERAQVGEAHSDNCSAVRADAPESGALQHCRGDCRRNRGRHGAVPHEQEGLGAAHVRRRDLERIRVPRRRSPVRVSDRLESEKTERNPGMNALRDILVNEVEHVLDDLSGAFLQLGKSDIFFLRFCLTAEKILTSLNDPYRTESDTCLFPVSYE